MITYIWRTNQDILEMKDAIHLFLLTSCWSVIYAKHTNSKRTAQWMLTYTLIQNHHPNQDRKFLARLGFLCTPSQLAPLPKDNHHSFAMDQFCLILDLFFWVWLFSPNLRFLRLTHVWPPWQSCVLFDSCLAFQCMTVPWFIYLCYCWWAFKLFPVGSY